MVSDPRREPWRTGMNRMMRRSRDKVCCWSGKVHSGFGWSPGKEGEGMCGSGRCPVTWQRWQAGCRWRWLGSASEDWRSDSLWGRKAPETDAQTDQGMGSGQRNLRTHTQTERHIQCFRILWHQQRSRYYYASLNNYTSSFPFVSFDYMKCGFGLRYLAFGLVK